MISPTVTETTPRLEAVTRDPFVAGLATPRAGDIARGADGADRIGRAPDAER